MKTKGIQKVHCISRMLGLLICSFLLRVSLFAQPEYRYIQVDPPTSPPASGVSFYAINDSGQVAASAYGTQTQRWHVLRWSKNVGFYLLYTASAGDILYGCTAINNSGTITDHRLRSSGDRGLVITNGGTYTIPASSSSNSYAWDVNDSDQVVGSSGLYCILWQNGDTTRFAVDGAAYAINNAGDIAYIQPGVKPDEFFAVLRRQNGATVVLPTPYARPYSLNNRREIVGYSASTTIAFYWSELTGSVNLPSLPGYMHSVAEAINDSGMIVGYVSNPGPLSRAVLWYKNSLGNYIAKDINDFIPPVFGADARWARDINNRGAIVGTVQTGSGARGYLLDPSSIDVTLPQQGKVWIAGEQDTVRWSAFGVNSVRISFSTDFENGSGTFTEIVQNYPADSGYYVWQIPDTILSRKSAIRIQDASDSTITDTSEVFRIKGYELTRINADSNYERFTFDEDRWNFGNTGANMWPLLWWSNFQYHGTDPYTGSSYPSDEPFSSAASSSFPDWPLFVQTFGVNNCYWSTLLGIYKNAAEAKWGAIKNPWYGSCSGFSLSCVMGFDNKGTFRARYPAIPDFVNLHSLTLNDSIRLVINELWIHWFGKQHQEFIDPIHNTKTPTQTVNDLKTLFLSEAQDHTYLYLANNSGGGAHAVVPYNVQKDGVNPDIWWIHVYDNSHHNNANAWIRVDTSSHGGDGSWTYALWPGWGGEKYLYVMDPASTYLTPPIFTTASPVAPPPANKAGTGTMEVFVTLGPSILIADALGNTTGYVDSAVINAMPGAIPLIPPTGSVTSPYAYRLPGGAYTMQMTDFRDSVSRLTLFADSTIISFKRSDALLTQEDRFTYDGGLSLYSGDPQVKRIRLETILTEEDTEEKVFALTNCPVSQNDSMYFSRTAGDNLTLRNFGIQKTYDLGLERASSTFYQRFLHPSVMLEGNSAHHVVPTWSDLSQPVVILIDLGNNGTIDDTLIVNNTVDVEDRGWLDVPKEYDLAQNYPNPFNSNTTIRYSLPTTQHVTLKVFNMLGQEVATLVEESQEPGYKSVVFDASGLASSVYFYRLSTAGFSSTRKLLLIK